MSKENDILGLKGISYIIPVSEYDIAVLDGLFAPKRMFNSKKSIESYEKGINLLNNLRTKNKISIDSYFIYQKVGNDSYFNTSRLITTYQSKLYKELYSISEELGIHRKIKNEESLQYARKSFQEAIEAFCYVTGMEKISDVSLSSFKSFVIPLRTEEDRWQPDLSTHVHRALRAMALCFDHHFNVAEFVKCVSVQRSDTRGKAKDLFYKPKEHMRKWVASWEDYLDAKQAFSTKGLKDSATKFRDFLESSYSSSDHFPDSPIIYFSKFRNEEFYKWLSDQVVINKFNERVLLSTLGEMNNYSNWFINTHMSEVDDDGQLVTIGYPILSKLRYDEIQTQYASENNVGQNLSESAKLSPPYWMLLQLKDILTKNDFSWPKSLSDQYNNSIVDTNGNPVWIPVITFLYLVMLEIPLRKIQVLRLDSGEGDYWKYDAQSDMWIKNDHAMASYWRNLGVRVQNRGVFRRKDGHGVLEPQFSLYINSNKISDKETGYGEKSGYEIPWKNKNIINYISKLREWQEKYNPVTAPVRYKDIPSSVFEGTPAKKVLENIPDRFYLFRSAKEIRNGNRQMPPTNRSLHEFWVQLMEELERELHEDGIECTIIQTRNKQSNAPQSALYSPHSLRVAGLTSLAQRGVPIEILSKIIAGHKNILMTIYYVKYTATHITEILNEAVRQNELSSQESFQRWLKEASWDDVAKYTAYNSTDALDSVKSATSESTIGLWNSVNLGICPYNGTRCHDGGKCIRKNGRKNTYLPVEDKNCVVCRHFITGLPWLTELWVHANSLLLQSEKKAIHIRENEQDIQALKVKQLNLRKEGKSVPPSLVMKIKKVQTIQERLAIEEDKIFNDLHSTHNLIEKIRQVQKQSVDDSKEHLSKNLPSLLIDENSDFEMDYLETPNNFSNLDFVIQASRIYKHERNEDFERERDQFIDTILLRNGFEPMMLMNLTTEEKQQSADAFAKFLVTKFDGETLQLLNEGRKTFVELGMEQELLNLTPFTLKPLNSIGRGIVNHE